MCTDTDSSIVLWWRRGRRAGNLLHRLLEAWHDEGMTKAPKDEKICVVVTKTYEILEDESAHRRSSHDEGIEVEYHDADGAH